MVWFEYNVHIRNRVLDRGRYINALDHYNNVRRILVDLVKPTVIRNRPRLNHWHYLVEPDKCRGNEYCEIQVRFNTDESDLLSAKRSFIGKLNWFARNNQIVMRTSEPSGSHEGSNGFRNQRYSGEASRFGSDWGTIVEILEKGSENALEIIELGGQLTQSASLRLDHRWLVKPYYLHLVANQLLVE